MLKLLVINGPNLNMLGRREPEIYGAQLLPQLDRLCMEWGEANDCHIECFQSNAEHELIDKVQSTASFGEHPVDGIVINAGGYTHTSVALADACTSIDVPYVEVHISNIFARERFRHHSYLSQHAAGVIAGMGQHGYTAALTFLKQHLANFQALNLRT